MGFAYRSIDGILGWVDTLIECRRFLYYWRKETTGFALRGRFLNRKSSAMVLSDRDWL